MFLKNRRKHKTLIYRLYYIHSNSWLSILTIKQLISYIIHSNVFELYIVVFICWIIINKMLKNNTRQWFYCDILLSLTDILQKLSSHSFCLSLSQISTFQNIISTILNFNLVVYFNHRLLYYILTNIFYTKF